MDTNLYLESNSTLYNFVSILHMGSAVAVLHHLWGSYQQQQLGKQVVNPEELSQDPSWFDVLCLAD